MLLDDTVNEKAWAQCERQSQEYEIASGRHEPFAGVKPRADVSENERREDGVGGEAQDCAQRSAEEGGAVEGTVRVEEGVGEREIEPRPSEEDAGCNRGDKAAEDERGGKIPNRHSSCSRARARFAIDLIASIFAGTAHLSSRMPALPPKGVVILDERSPPGTLAAKR